MARKVKYELDLVRAFNHAYRDKSQAVRDKLRPLISDPQVKRSIGRAVVEKIKKNTQNQLDKNGKLFIGANSKKGKREYSDAYIDSLAFKVYGKSPNIINLTLSSQMLNSMIPSSPGNKVVVSIAPDQSDKAHGHVNGTRYLPKRDFLGLPKDQESEIVKKIIDSASSSRVDLAISDIAEAIATGNQAQTLALAESIASEASNNESFLILLAEGLDDGS